MLTISSVAVLLAIFGHLIGDWLLQPRWMALRKSKEVPVLVGHVAIACAALLPLAILTDSLRGLAIYAVLHAIQDWFIWRIAPLWVKEINSKQFYDTIAIDQALHGLCIWWMLMS
jgi:Protein of unknown function (DUF3307)